MVRWLLLFSALLLACWLLQACSHPGTPAIVGSWRLAYVTHNPANALGQYMSDSLATEMGRLNPDERLIISSDSTCERRINGRASSGRWRMSGDSLLVVHPNRLLDLWHVVRQEDDTLVLARIGNDSRLRVYSRESK